ncbi:hypothetical protein K3F74_18310 [Acinetobacter baumannii]|uniref:DUF6236 family protein n=1 Tax=Acinetobacter baumannii TaxID=470 RepID=UPI0023407955|nr:DUF6236 family protein [Acinetobacter baumannii]MDC4016370.1 hypothetical protein [Acinetobacter baumannii]
MGEIIQFKKKRISKGLIISGLGGVSNENGPVAKDLTHSDLMFYGLYWDKIVITQIPMFHFTNNVIEEFRTNGVIEFYTNAPPPQIHSSEMQRLALESLLACQSIRKQTKDSDWIIYNNVADGFNSIESDDLIEQHTIRIEISKCLPYPSTYVPIDTLRKFREDYIDELDSLHLAKYRLFDKISSYENLERRDLAKSYELEEFQRAIKDYEFAFSSKFSYYSMKSLISDIKSNKSQLLEASLATGDLLISGFSLSGTYNLGKTFFNIFGSKQKIHEVKKNSPEFQFIGSAINKGIILQKFDHSLE